MPFNYSLKRLLITSSHYIPYYPFVQNNDLYENSAKNKNTFRSVQLVKRTLKHSSPNFKKKNYLLWNVLTLWWERININKHQLRKTQKHHRFRLIAERNNNYWLLTMKMIRWNGRWKTQRFKIS
jgi:hypothetical protein